MDLGQSFPNINHLQDPLLLVRGNVEVGGNQISKDRWRFDVGDHCSQFGSKVRSEFNRSLKEIFQIHHEGVDLNSLRNFFLKNIDFCLEIRVLLIELLNL